MGRFARSVTRALLIVVLVSGLVSVELGTAASASPGDPLDEASWILAAQGPAGEIATHADRTYVDPYLGAFGALGLAAATRATGAPAYADSAWRFVEWYSARMDASGYVTDYRIEAGTLVSTGDFDSTDAYAGVFLLAVDGAYAAAPNRARLLALMPAVRRAVGAIRSTLRPDGLTGAKPAWMVAYLMNEAEAFAGLQAASRLAKTIGDRTLSRDADALAATIDRAVARLWNPATGALDWAVHPNGVRIPTSWSQLYPDALSQVWAVRFGLLRGNQARDVLVRFLQTHPGAHDPNTIDLVDGRSAPTGYWPGIGMVLGLVDKGAPARFRDGTRAALTATNRAWPYSVQVAGDLVRLVTGR